MLDKIIPPAVQEKAVAAALTAAAALGVSTLASKEIRSARMDACLACDKLADGRCTARTCRCYVTQLSRVDKGTCPLGRWPVA